MSYISINKDYTMVIPSDILKQMNVNPGKKYQIINSAPKEAVEFLKTDDDFVIAFKLNAKKAKSGKNKNNFIVILNGNPAKKATVNLPKGSWSVVANEKKVSIKKPIANFLKTAVLPPTSGMILINPEK